MACPWEQAIQDSAGLENAQESVDYLTILSELLQPLVQNAPTERVTFLPPRPNIRPRNDRSNRGQQGTNRRNNRFHHESDDEDAVPLNVPPQNVPNRGSSRWSAEDVFVQVITTLGEMLGKLAMQLTKERLWKLCAEKFMRSATLLNLAQQYADTMYARITQRAELGDNEVEEIAERVRHLCSAVNIAAGHAIDKREQFERKAEARRRQLEEKLNPQWQDRDTARARIGDEAWTNNPNPRGDFAKRRAADEKELRELNAAVAAVAALDFEGIRQMSEHRRRVA